MCKHLPVKILKQMCREKGEIKHQGVAGVVPFDFFFFILKTCLSS